MILWLKWLDDFLFSDCDWCGGFDAEDDNDEILTDGDDDVDDFLLDFDDFVLDEDLVFGFDEDYQFVFNEV